jgi:hypothetical protein
MNKKIHIVGGGTVSHSSCHLGLSAPAFGSTARKIEKFCREKNTSMDIILHLTSMAGGHHDLQSPSNLKDLAESIISDFSSKIVFWSPAVADFNLIVDTDELRTGENPKYAGRLSSLKEYAAKLVPNKEKIVDLFRKTRKDITLVAFKTTCGATEDEQYLAGLNLLKKASANLVLANDTKHRRNMIIVPEEARYCVTHDRDEVLRELVHIALLRSTLTFTRSTVVAGEPVPWDSDKVPSALRNVVNYCVERGAYKKFRNVTAGHFAVKLTDTSFLSSRRKTDLGDIKNVGLVYVETDGPDTVIAYGSKPSVGGQSQRIVFNDHPGLDSIVHFHCPKKESSLVPTVSQKEYECGSHQCGKNTSDGLKQFGRLKAVYLDNHGPNIVFDSREPNIDQEVIKFIEDNFYLEQKTGGLTE